MDSDVTSLKEFVMMRVLNFLQAEAVNGLLFQMFSRAAVNILLCVIFFAANVDAQSNFSPSFREIVPGLDYAHYQTTNWNNGDPWSIHIARMDRSRKDLRLAEHLARDRVLGTAPVSAIAASYPKQRGEPLVAINAGFCFRTKSPYIGAPRGVGKNAEAAMVVVDGEVVGAPSKYGFLVDENRSMRFGRFDSRFTATLPDGTILPIGLNNECKPGGFMLYTHRLGANTRATNNFELVLEDPKRKQLSWRVGESYVMQVKALNPSGNSTLSNSIAVLSFGSEMNSMASRLKQGDKIEMDLKTSPELKKVVTACHVIFPIVENGKALETFDASKAMQYRNPRTAIGFNDQYFFMVVIDGRQKELSMGVNLPELAEIMIRLGCMEAGNLDGGGSSTFWMQGERRNSVPGGKERDRADSLMIVRQSGGDAFDRRTASK